MSHVPIVLAGNGSRVTMDKMGLPLDAADADLGCNGMHHLACGVHLHGVGDGGVAAIGAAQTINMVSLDSALVSIGPASPVPTPMVVPDVRGGVHFALVGNIWNTNYPFWYPFVEEDGSSQFRFLWRFE